MPYTHLSRAERKVIHQMRIGRFSVADMARALGRHRSTIYRELRRNALGPDCYVWGKAHTRYRQRLRWERMRPRRGHGPLMRYIRGKLSQYWSPEQIAGRLPLAYPEDSRMRVSWMTIYRFVQDDRRAGGRWWRYLRQSRKQKRKRYGSHDQRGHLQGRVFIEERPKTVARQCRFGDWEADTMWGTTRCAYLATFVERKSLYLVAGRMGSRSAAELNRAARLAFRRIPRALRKTLTVDNGKEFAAFTELKRSLGTDIYFAHPYAAWERGINENCNGLLRQFLPKKTDLAQYSERTIKRAVRLLNHRPRKKLGYRTPHEVFTQACVALEL